MEHNLTTNKPWTLLLFALAVINIIGILCVLGGVDNPIAMLETTDTIYMPSVTVAPATTDALDIMVVLSLALWVIIAYGIAMSHTWTWWLLAFQTIVTLVTGVLMFLTGQPVAIVGFIIQLVMFAALFKREVVSEFSPKLTILPPDGLW